MMVSNGAATLDGTITMNGITASAFCNAGYSGGAGGSIFIQANVILGSGSLSANGGAGTGCSGGGGGGIIVLSDHGGDNINSSAVSINGGAGAHNGGNGIFSEINF